MSAKRLQKRNLKVAATRFSDSLMVHDCHSLYSSLSLPSPFSNFREGGGFGWGLSSIIKKIINHRTFPRASDANIPTKQREANMPNANLKLWMNCGKYSGVICTLPIINENSSITNPILII